MPLYEYTCQDCRQTSEVLVRGQEAPVCEHCGGRRLDKQFSVPAAPRGVDHSASLPMAGMCGRPQCASGGCQGLG